MVAKEDTESYQTCSRLLEEGKFEQALVEAEAISEPSFRAAIFIDGGFALSRSGKVREGTRIFESLLSSEQPAKEFARSSLLYNAANGRSSLYALRRKRRKRTVPTNDADLRAAKEHFRDALSTLKSKHGPFASQVLTNYSNCLSEFGRYIEAIVCYQEALDADLTNGMAAGNLGMELEHAARIMGRYRHEYIALAHDYLTRALSPAMHLKYGTPAAIQMFRSVLERLQHFIDAHSEPILPPRPIEVVAQSDDQKKYIQFCIRNGLFLNAWVGNKELTPGITDDVHFGPITTATDDTYFVPELLRILNEIKESFAVARYVYYLSQRQDDEFDAISGITLYTGTELEVKGIYTGLCKTAYARAFDVLDKVARIINVYFRIGNREDSFWDILAEKQSLGEKHTIRFAARPAICQANNYSLFALADLCIDYFVNKRVDLKLIDARRNRITHDYLSVKLYATDAERNDISTVDLDDFRDQTRDVMHLAKYAILYAVSAISIAEGRNEDSSGKAFPFQYWSSPGQPFL